MNAIPKALAMANPKHVAACVASAACVISSKFVIDAVGYKLDDTDMEEDDNPKPSIKRKADYLNNEEIDKVIGEVESWDWDDFDIKKRKNCLAAF